MSEYYSSYEGFARTLRGWLVGFGIGAPVVLLTNEEIFKIFKDNIEQAREIAFYFFGGCLIQIILAFTYMLMMNYFYVNEVNLKRLVKAEKRAKKNNQPKPCPSTFNLNKCWYRLLHWLSYSWQLEMLLNATSIFLFAVAILKSLNLLLPAISAAT